MTELELFVDFYKGTRRQGPGSAEETLKALKFTDLQTHSSLQIADIGCGAGAQTLTLAQHLGGKITAVDLFPQFLRDLEKGARAQGLEQQITTLEASMTDLPFKKNSLDLIWSEGAIYIMGFEAGIQYWRNFLKTGGYLAISEITWTTNARPKAIEDFWTQEYPEIATAASKIQQLETHGFNLVGYFELDSSSWLKNYYQPLEENFVDFLERHKHTSAAQKIVADQKAEIALYQQYQEYYNYGFYIARKS